MATSDPKADLHRYLQAAREALVWKLASDVERAGVSLALRGRARR